MLGGLIKNHCGAMGVDMAHDGLRVAQLETDAKGVRLVALEQEQRPVNVEPGTVAWQHWAIDALKEMARKGRFKGRCASASLPGHEILIETIKASKTQDGKFEEGVLSRVKARLPSCSASRQSLLIKRIPMEQDNVMVMATDRELVHRYLAIFENGGLDIRFIGTWPEALHKTYLQLFGAQADPRAVVMLLDVQDDSTGVVICRHADLLFARSLPMGSQVVSDAAALDRLVLELAACRRDCMALYTGLSVSRVVFLAWGTVDLDLYQGLARAIGLQTQVGDCQAAVIRAEDQASGHGHWITALGLSLL